MRILTAGILCAGARALILTTSFGVVSGLHSSIAGAQDEKNDARRVTYAIDAAIKARNLSPDAARKARTALRKASEDQPDIRNALLFGYAADAAISWDRSTKINLDRGYDFHLLGNLDELIRPSGYEPLAVMAERWEKSAGNSHINYSAFKIKMLTPSSEAWAVNEVGDDPTTMQAVNEYLEMRHAGQNPDAAFDKVIGRLDVLRDVLSRWGQSTVSGYTSFEAGKDARDYVEAYYQYWYFKREGQASHKSQFMAADPLRMISRRIVAGMRADQKTMLIPVESVIDEATKQSESGDAEPVKPEGGPSFEGLERVPTHQELEASDAPAIPMCMGKKVEDYDGPYMEVLFPSVDRVPTTASSYCRRMSTFYFFARTRSNADYSAMFGNAKLNSIPAWFEKIRVRDGEPAAFKAFDSFVKYSRRWWEHPTR